MGGNTMVTGLYACLLTFLFIGLSFNVIRWRRQLRVSLGDGGNESLGRAVAAQANASEYIPIGLLLLFTAELSAAPVLIIHTAGILFFIGRFLHMQSLLYTNFKKRTVAMLLTFFVIASLAITHLVLFIQGSFF